jgi:glutamine synthetase
MEIGVGVLPKLPRDAGDRNRTSPFAFTGNKFEFRAVGSSQSIAGPNTVLNTIVAESLDFIASRLEQAQRDGHDLNRAIQELLPGIIRESKKVLFHGDNYTPEWHAEAERRGLPNLKNTVDALPVILRKDTVELFGKYRVYSERELQSRYTIYCESYVKTITVEARLTAMMARTMVLPAALRYQTLVAGAVLSARSAGADTTAQQELLKSLTATIGELQQATAGLDDAVGHHHGGDVTDHARAARDRVVPAMAAVRMLSDRLEAVVADDLWPLPTYREMLFVR